MAELVKLNAETYPGLAGSSKLMEGTVLQLPPGTSPSVSVSVFSSLCQRSGLTSCLWTGRGSAAGKARGDGPR